MNCNTTYDHNSLIQPTKRLLSPEPAPCLPIRFFTHHFPYLKRRSKPLNSQTYPLAEIAASPMAINLSVKQDH